MSGSTSATVVFILWNHLVWGTGNISQPAVIVRALSAKDVRTAKTSTAWSGIVFVGFYIALMMLGGTARILFPNLQDPDFAFPTLVTNIFHPVFGGILMCSILAMIMSTTDSLLLVVGSTVGKDLYQDFINPKASVKDVLKVSRIAIICVGIIAGIFSLIKPTTILKLQIFNYSTIGATFFIPMMAGFYWERATREGAIASMIGGAATNLLWYALNKPLFPSAWVSPYSDLWELMLRARAAENQLYTIGINRAGEGISTHYFGCSMIVDPCGKVSSEYLDDEEERLLIGNVNKSIIKARREEIPWLKYRLPELYSDLNKA